MAARLPVVVSDWDDPPPLEMGLRDSVFPPGPPMPGKEELALQHDPGLLSYQDYVGAVAQHVAVDTEAAAAAVCASLRISPAPAHG